LVAGLILGLAAFALAQSAVAVERMRGDPERGPWRAVAKLQAAAGGFRTICTATLVAPDIALTAAHCAFNRRTGRYFLPPDMHVLIGYRGDAYDAHAQGLKLVVGPGYDPLRPLATLGADWALLVLDRALGPPERTLAIAETPPEAGTAITTGGYGRDHPLQLMIAPSCQITGLSVDEGKRPILLHDCTAIEGDSGAPLLVRSGSGWRIGGVVAAEAKGATRGAAAALEPARAALAVLAKPLGRNRAAETTTQAH
jgi:protease YdgD